MKKPRFGTNNIKGKKPFQGGLSRGLYSKGTISKGGLQGPIASQGPVATGGPPRGAVGAAPTAPSPTSPLPWDAQYETQSGLLNRDLQNTDAQLAYQEQQTRSDYGFDPQYASNPLSRANLLQRSYDQSRLSATNSMAARGQLYSGATSNQLDYADFAHNRGYSALQSSYQDTLNKIAQGRISAQQAHDEGIASARADALSRALQQTPEAITPGSDGGGDQGSVGGDQGSAGGGTRKGVKNAARRSKMKGGIVQPLRKRKLIGGSPMPKRGGLIHSIPKKKRK